MHEKQIKQLVANRTKICKEMYKMEANMYKCAAQCLEDELSGYDSVQNCKFKCDLPVSEIKKFYREVFARTQESTIKCLKDCSDKIPSRINRIFSKDSFSKQRRTHEDCVSRCIDKYCGTFFSLEKAMNDVIIFQSEQLRKHR